MENFYDPVENFKAWIAEAEQAGIADANAMALATVDHTSKPSVRMVYFKGFIGEGLSFYTNYNSRKGREIVSNNRAAAVFYWQPLNRQVRIEGTLHRLPREASRKYFASRPLLSQISSYISQQSREIPSYEHLQEEFAREVKRHSGETSLPCPTHWGGYVLTPQEFEFYRGHEHRLNERLVYRRAGRDAWQRKYLSP